MFQRSVIEALPVHRSNRLTKSSSSKASTKINISNIEETTSYVSKDFDKEDTLPISDFPFEKITCLWSL